MNDNDVKNLTPTGVWVALCEDDTKATFAYVFVCGAERPEDVAEEVADNRALTLVEVMPVEDFLQYDVYELCAN